MLNVRDYAIVCAIFVLVIAGAFAFEWRLTRSPDDAVYVNTRKLMDLPEGMKTDMVGPVAYQWFDAHTILVHALNSDFAVDVPDGRKWTPIWIKRAQALIKAKSVGTDFYGWRVSPDGHWAVTGVFANNDVDSQNDTAHPNDADLKNVKKLLANPAQSIVEQGRWVLADVKTGNVRDLGIDTDPRNDVVWRLDSAGWYEARFQPGKLVAWSRPGSTVSRESVALNGIGTISLEPLGAVANDELMLLDAQPAKDGAYGTPCTLVQMGPNGLTQIRHWVYPAGKDATPSSTSVSPTGDQVACSYLIEPGSDEMMAGGGTARIGPSYGEIRVARIGDPNERVVYRSKPSAGDYDGPRFVAWTPDGKHVSYIDHGALWSVPVD